MKKLKKLFSVCFALLLVATATVTGTLAYENLTADDMAKNESNHIAVQLVQQKTGADGTLIDITDSIDSPILMPLKDGFTENIVKVKNIGNISSFNRVLIAVPSDLDEAVELIASTDEGWKLTQTYENQTCETDICNVYIYTYEHALPAEKDSASISSPAIYGVRLNSDIEQFEGSYVLNNKTYDFNNGLKLRIYAQSVQSAFLQTAESAFSTAKLSDNPWEPLERGAVNMKNLKTIIKTLPTGKDIEANITKVVFGKRNSYNDITSSCYGQPVDEEKRNGPWAYYQASTTTVDETEVTTWTVYVLSDEIIFLPDDCQNLFKGWTALKEVDTTNLDTSNVTKMENMFMGCSNLKKLDVHNWDTSNVISMSQMFHGCENLEVLDVSNWNTSKVNSMAQMFHSCKKLVSLDTSRWDVSNVTSWNYMFFDCNNLTSVNVDKWVTSKTTSISYMFAYCYNLQNIDTNNWDTSNVTDMGEAFYQCKSVEVLDVEGWDTSAVTSMDQMFHSCEKVNLLDVSKWDTSKVSSMARMFWNCKSLTSLDLSSFSAESLDNPAFMLGGCSKLATIYVSDKWVDTFKVNDFSKTEIFTGSTKLVGGNGTTNRGNDKKYGIYAIVDGGTENPGLLTLKSANGSGN